MRPKPLMPTFTITGIAVGVCPVARAVLVEMFRRCSRSGDDVSGGELGM